VVVVFYVPAMKLMYAVTVSTAGIVAIFGFPFSKKKKNSL
jgi:hypothetical protein